VVSGKRPGYASWKASSIQLPRATGRGGHAQMRALGRVGSIGPRRDRATYQFLGGADRAMFAHCLPCSRLNVQWLL
jgi:hypothetical protein